MAAFILTLIGTFLIAAAVWLTVGSKLQFSPDREANEIVNFVVYAIVALPIAFLLVFFGLGG